jgi:competence protein ComEA
VNLNTATAAALEELPGVGPVLAQRIVDWRTEHGRFTSVDELAEVSGIGEKMFASLQDKVTV